MSSASSRGVAAAGRWVSLRSTHPAGLRRAHKNQSRGLSHLHSRPCMLHQCPAHSPHQVHFCCRCCRPLRSPRPLTSGTSIIGMATASCPAIISRRTTTFPFMVRREQSATHRRMRQVTGITAGSTISAILDIYVDATTAAVSARAGRGRPSGRFGIVGRNPTRNIDDMPIGIVLLKGLKETFSCVERGQ